MEWLREDLYLYRWHWAQIVGRRRGIADGSSVVAIETARVLGTRKALQVLSRDFGGHCNRFLKQKSAHLNVVEHQPWREVAIVRHEVLGYIKLGNNRKALIQHAVYSASTQCTIEFPESIQKIELLWLQPCRVPFHAQELWPALHVRRTSMLTLF